MSKAPISKMPNVPIIGGGPAGMYFAILMNVLPILYRLGVSPQTLQRAYGDVR